nr:hypothetical protein [Tanacetum cinerariifolium]
APGHSGARAIVGGPGAAGAGAHGAAAREHRGPAKAPHPVAASRRSSPDGQLGIRYCERQTDLEHRHLLFATKLNFDRVEALVPAEVFKGANQLLDEAIQETRRVSHELVPATLAEVGLA